MLSHTAAASHDDDDDVHDDDGISSKNYGAIDSGWAGVSGAKKSIY
jgi:hypothetical protein